MKSGKELLPKVSIKCFLKLSRWSFGKNISKSVSLQGFSFNGIIKTIYMPNNSVAFEI